MPNFVVFVTSITTYAVEAETAQEAEVASHKWEQIEEETTSIIVEDENGDVVSESRFRI